MDIPVLTNFIDGLKLFFASKRLKWLTLIFFIGAFTITIWQNLGFYLIIYIAGIMSVPKDIIEAAEIRLDTMAGIISRKIISCLIIKSISNSIGISFEPNVLSIKSMVS